MLLGKHLVGGGDEADVRMLGAILAELLGIGHELLGIDHRRIVFAAIIAIHPGQDDADIVLGRGLEFRASPSGKIDRRGKGRGAGDGEPQRERARCTCDEYHE